MKMTASRVKTSTILPPWGGNTSTYATFGLYLY